VTRRQATHPTEAALSEAGPEEFAEFGAAALDFFQNLFEQTAHFDHRGDDDHARELLGDLLIDLMHYAERRNLEFNDILAQAQSHYLGEQQTETVFSIGSTVQLQGPVAEGALLVGQPTRGTVTGFLVQEHGPTQYYVHFLGEPSNRSLIAADLEPAPPFPAAPITGGVITDPLRAEKSLVETMTRVGQAETEGVQPKASDLRDQQVLLDAVVTWNDMDERNVTDLLLAQVASRLPGADPQNRPEPPTPGRLTPSQLAAQAFPVPLGQGLATEPPDAPTTPAQRSAAAPQKAPNPNR